MVVEGAGKPGLIDLEETWYIHQEGIGKQGNYTVPTKGAGGDCGDGRNKETGDDQHEDNVACAS